MGSRLKVLECFKCLHRASRDVFHGDGTALNAAGKKIKDEFEKHKGETDEKKIAELVQLGFHVARVLRTSVIQAKLTPEGNYRIKITKHTELGTSPGAHLGKNDDI